MTRALDKEDLDKIRGNGHTLFYSGALLEVLLFTSGAVAFDSGVVAEAGHWMTPFFVFDTLPLGVFTAADFEFLTPETDVGQKSFSMFEHSCNV